MRKPGGQNNLVDWSLLCEVVSHGLTHALVPYYIHHYILVPKEDIDFLTIRDTHVYMLIYLIPFSCCLGSLINL